MSKTKLPVQLITTSTLPENHIRLGERLIKSLRIPTDQSLTLEFGSFRQEIRIVPGKKLYAIRISPSLSQAAGLLPGTVVSAAYRAADHVLKLGPVLGVMIGRYDPKDREKPFGSISSFCMEMIHASRKLGAFVYFFTPDMIGTGSQSLQGIWYDRGWKKGPVPLPDVINNRLATRKLENSPSVQHFMKEVKSRYRTPVFNEKFLDKSEVFEALAADERLKRYLPESYLLKSYPTLKKMCSSYPVVFLKPVRGSLGKGIIRITLEPDGSCHTLTTSLEGTIRRQYSSLKKLYSGLSGKLAKERYQIQQGLNLIRNQKKNVDFRALVHKNMKGKWSVTSIVGRIAGGNHFVSNLARGGTLSTVKEALAGSSLSAAFKNQLPAKMEQAALEIAKGVETYIPYHFGELGIDLAVDTSGRIWLLEVNSKPSKSDDAPLNNEDKVRPSAMRLLQYSQYLSGFQ
ncbi:YheC/YheD family protein [Paenibacillus sp. F411]|uniref:YheC/YheD family endospore coat-associated protein n=1 Tax=unclassified Paenibacillus TaxID=185978 RepID=UPI001AAEA051|nr:YheC/YheD family protein [Paenibacillus sp. F411]MBO2942478.1 YheC/YheD family protein [Paenibacillus sp. F411]